MAKAIRQRCLCIITHQGPCYLHHTTYPSSFDDLQIGMFGM